MKKKIIIIILFSIILISSIIILKYNYNLTKIDNQDFNNLVNDSIFVEPIIINKKENKISINNQLLNSEETEIKEISNKYNIKIKDKSIDFDLGYQKVISHSNFLLKDNFYIIEFLLGKKDNLEYLNDKQLSTTYDSVLNYSKIWFLYDEKINSYYKIVDTSDDFFLFLNTTINENKLEFDYMAKSGVSNTIANHYKIDIDELILKVTNNEIFDYYNYSTLENNEFVLDEKNKKETINTELNKENIKIEIYEKYDNTKNSYSGFKLTINDITEEVKMDFPSKNIGIINLKENLDGIVLINETTGINDYQTIIYTFIDNKFIKVFNNNKEIEEFKIKGIKDIDIEKDNNYFIFTVYTGDFIQNWTLKTKYILNEKNQLQLVNEKYYEAKKIITSKSTRDIFVYLDNNYNSEKKLIPKDSEVEFIGTDLLYWGIIIFEGNRYYLPIDKNGNIKDLGKPAIYVFNDLLYGN